MTKKKTPRGSGYTVRVGGRKYLTANLLEEQVEAAQQQLMELTQQNELLRSKEAKHLEALETVEAVLHTLGAVVEQPAPGTKQHAKWLEAVLLDMQALTLKQALQLSTAAAVQQDSLAPSSMAPSPGAVAPSIQAASEATCSLSTCSSMHTTGSEASSGMSLGASTSSSRGGDNPHSNSKHRVTRLLASLTPEEIMQCKACTMAELAARFKAGKDRLAKTRAASLAAGPGDTSDLDRAVTEYGRLCLLSLMSDESRHCRVIGMNLETLQPETMSDECYNTVVESTQLQPEQVQQLCLAYRMFHKVEGELMQQQQEVMQQLQGILGPGVPHEFVASMLPPEAAAGALPPADSAAAAAGRPRVMLEPGSLPPAAARVKVGATDAAAAAAGGAGSSAGKSQAATLLSAAGGPAPQLSPQLQHLLKLRAKGAARAAAAAGAAAGASGSRAKQGGGPAASSSTQEMQSDGVLPAGAAAGMPHNSSSSSKKGKEGVGSGSGSAQQVVVPGDTPHGQLSSKTSSSGVSGTREPSALSTPGSSSSMSAQELLLGGVLGVEASEKVEKLLESLMCVGWGLKHNGRNLATMGMNLMSSAQYADSVIAAWPYFISPQRFCAVVAQANPGL